MKKLEAYLLRTGKFSLFFSSYFYKKYGSDIAKVVVFFRNWQVIEEGYRNMEAYRPFLQSYSWSWDQFMKIVKICIYLDLLEAHQDGATRATYLHLSRKDFYLTTTFA